MQIIIASDIFGRTPELEDFATDLSSNAIKTTIVDPYQGNNMEFKDEADAYAYFQKNIGMEQYKNIVFKNIEQNLDSLSDLFLVGFSVGASAIWAISDKISNQAKAICFYGSQIRSFLNIDPKIEIEFFFPEQEPHFDVTKLISKLSNRKNVKCYLAPYLHGFMNQKSDNFNKTGYNKYLQLLKTKMI